ncbi:MAG: hypothetical protein JWN34_4121 [Bryobacterales bacterium]|nr:hypothetical protein [Bryobacterales bacterium]
MNRNELIRLIVLNEVCDDYENLDQTILANASSEARRHGFVVSRRDVVEALTALLHCSLIKAYRLAPQRAPEVLVEMPDLSVAEQNFTTYFFATPEGMAVQSATPDILELAAMPRYIEVSHVIEAGMKTYPGLPVPTVEVLMDYEASHEKYDNQAEFYIASLHLCGNTGTYVDSPRHRYRTGTDLAALPLRDVAHVPVTVIDARVNNDRAIGPEFFGTARIKDRAVLVNTGWSQHWRTDTYYQNNPFLTAAACEFLVAAGARFVGIDSLNIDNIDDPARPAHTLLLGADIPVCEHMTNLDSLEPEGGFLHAVPIAWASGATFPVRAYVIYDGPELP